MEHVGTISGTEILAQSITVSGLPVIIQAVTSINNEIGPAITLAGAGAVDVTTAGDVITISGTGEGGEGGGGGATSNAMVGTDGITVLSGVPTTGETTISGFRTEFVAASGSLRDDITSSSFGGSLFDVYDNTGGQTFTTSPITVNLDTIRKDTGEGVFSLSADEVTVNSTASFIFIIRVSSDVDAGTIRNGARAWLERDSVEVDGTRAFSYHRTFGQGEGTAVSSVILDVTAGEVFRVRTAREYGGDTLITIADASSLTIFSAGGQQGPQGEPGTSLIGADGITVISGVPISSQTTVSGFQTEFVSASGTLATQVTTDIATHTAIADAHHIRYTKDENDAIVAGTNITVVSGSNIITINSTGGGGADGPDIDSINTVTGTMTLGGADGITIVDDTVDSDTPILTVSGFRTEFVNASGTLQSAIDTTQPDVDSLNSLTGDVTIIGKGEVGVTVEGQNVVVSGTDHAAANNTDTISDAMIGTDGITVISGVPTESETTISGFRTEFVAASGSLQSEIDAIDSSVTLQDAYDNSSDGRIVATTSKPVVISGTGEFEAGNITSTGTVTASGGLFGDFLQAGDGGISTPQIFGHPNNEALAPAFSFVGDSDTGMLLQTSNTIRFTCGGTIPLHLSSVLVRAFRPFNAQPGTAIDDLGFTFTDDMDTGIYQVATGDGSIAFASDGAAVGYFDANKDLHVVNDALVSGTVDTGNLTAVTGTFSESLTVSGIPVRIDSQGAGAGVDDVNSVVGSVVIAGAGEVSVSTAGQTITISGTDHTAGGGGGTVSDAMVGADGITVLSGVPTESETTVSGFRTEFVSASGTIQTELDNHTGDATLHFTEGSIDHTAIQNIGSNTHAEIDTHLAGLAASGVATDANIVSVSGHLQSEINAVEGSDVDAITVSGGSDITGTIDFVGSNGVNVSSAGNIVTFDGSGVAGGGGGGGGINNVVEDLTPQLGGDLDVNGHHVFADGTNNVKITSSGLGQIQIFSGKIDQPEDTDNDIWIAASGSGAGDGKITLESNFGSGPINLLSGEDVNISASSGRFVITGNTASSVSVSNGNLSLNAQTGKVTFDVSTVVESDSPFVTALESASSPSFSFTVDADTGMFGLGDNVIGFAASGTQRVTISGVDDQTDGMGIDGNLTVTGTVASEDGRFDRILIGEGSEAAPSIVFANEVGLDTGFYRSGEDAISVTAGGSEKVVINAAGTNFLDRVTHAENGTANLASYTFFGDLDTGMYKVGTNILGLAAGGKGITISGVGDDTDGVGVDGNLTVTGTVAADEGHFEDSLTVSGIPVRIDSGGGAGVDDVNSVTGSVVIAGTGDVNVSTAGQTITIEGTPANALVGADGITVTSGDPTDTITGFRAEFVNASGTLSTQITDDIETHDAITDAHHAKYTDAEAIIALEPTTSNLAASGVATDAAVVVNTTLITTTSGHLQSEINTHTGDATIHFTEGSIDHTAIQNIGTNSHAAIDIHLGSLLASGVADEANLVSVSGHLQGEIDAVESSDVDDVNSVVGSVTIAGAGKVNVSTDGQTITVEGIPSNALVGATNVTVTSGSPTDTIAGATLTKNIAIESPDSSEDLSWFFTPLAITVTEVTSVSVGSTPSTTISIMHNTNRSSAGNNVLTAATATTSTTTGDNPAIGGDTTIPADSFVWLETSAQSGTVDILIVSLTYTED